MSGPIPAELGNLSNLQWLYLSENQLSGPIPAEMGNLSKLQVLTLRGNQLSGPIPAELGNLSNLQVLYLLGNQLTGTIPTEMGSLAKLEELFLSGNQLTGCIPVGIAAVANNDLNQLGLPFCAGALGPPTISSITPGVASISVTWAAPSMASGVTIIAYGLRYIESAASDKSDANWTMVDNAWTTGSGALSYQISGLTSGTQYDVQVRAVTAAGDGLWSVAAAVTPATWAAIRSFSSASVSPGGQVMVTITANGYGLIGTGSGHTSPRIQPCRQQPARLGVYGRRPRGEVRPAWGNHSHLYGHRAQRGGFLFFLWRFRNSNTREKKPRLAALSA